jgi:hypothetical protein
MEVHDVDADSGGATYEEAIVNVAREIYDKHGNDRQVLAQKWKGHG